MNAPVPDYPTEVPTSAGAQLRAYREAAQLTVDDVAHHLKLARRQVLAIENDELDALPGPTFVRGFIRNYARLLRIDAAPLLEATGVSPTSSPTAAMEQIAPTMGELPVESDRSGSWTRWLIPTALILVLAAGVAYYEFGGVSNGNAKKARKEAVEATAPATTLQPPLSQDAAPAADASTQPPVAPQAPTAVAVPESTPPARPPSLPAQGPSPAVTATTAAPSATAAAPASTAATPSGSKLELSFTGKSWVEVRDATGATLVSRTLDASQPQTLSGSPPYTVTIGNSRAAQVRYNDKSVDLAPYTQREIARLTLPLRK